MADKRLIAAILLKEVIYSFSKGKKMRFVVSSASFVISFALGIALSFLLLSSQVPNYDQAELKAKVGRRVQYTSRGSNQLTQCSPEDTGCLPILTGTRGQVVGVEEVSPGDYLLVIQWEGPEEGQRLRSYLGYRAYREFLAEE